MLLAGNTRFNINIVANYIGTNEEYFAELIRLMLKGETPVSQRAAWAIQVLTDNEPWLLKPYVEDIVEKLPSFQHPALRRAVLRYLSLYEVPEKSYGSLIHLCYNYLTDNKLPVAIRVYAMQIIYNISEQEPDLKEELRLTIESFYDSGSGAFKSRGGKLLKKLSMQK